MLNHSKAPIRKKAILVLHSIIQKYPEAIDQSWHRLQEKLEDTDPGVVSAAVNIICELGRRFPQKFLALSPQLFELLTTSTNNWMLIKIVKLFGALTPHEPRLVRKLLPPIKSIISTTPALSLLYECINSVISGDMLDGPGGDELAEACVDKLAAFLEDEDRNLRYISLLALTRILPTHPHLVSQYQEAIMNSLDDGDLSIRIRALDLTAGMASRRNLHTILNRLLKQVESTGATKREMTGNVTAAEHLKRALAGGKMPLERPDVGGAQLSASSPAYKAEVAGRIVTMSQANTYANVQDFEDLLGVLIRLAKSPEAKAGANVRDLIIDITARVRAARPFAVRQLVKMLNDDVYLSGTTADQKEVLRAAAWVCGEYWEEVDNPRLVAPLLLRVSREGCAATVTAECIHNSVKLFAHWTAALTHDWDSSRVEEVKNVVFLMLEGLAVFTKSTDTEVAGRACEFSRLFEFLQKDLEGYKPPPPKPNLPTASASSSSSSSSLTPAPVDDATATWGSTEPLASTSASTSVPKGPKSLHLLAPLFSPAPLGPVGEQAQSKVPLPPGMDLNAPIVPLSFTIPSLSRKGRSLEPGEANDSSAKAKSKGKSKTASKVRGKLAENGQGKGDDPEAELAKAAAARRKERQRADPFYLGEAEAKKSRPSSKKKSKGKEGSLPVNDEDDLDDVPIVQLSLEDLPPGFAAAGPSASGSVLPPDGKSGTRTSSHQQKWILEQEEMPPDQAGTAAANEAAADAAVPEPSEHSSAAVADGAVAGGETVKKKSSKKKKKVKAAGIVLD